MCYVVISCEPRDGSARRIYVKYYQVDQVHSEVLEQSLREARELCRARECEFDVYLRPSLRPSLRSVAQLPLPTHQVREPAVELVSAARGVAAVRASARYSLPGAPA